MSDSSWELAMAARSYLRKIRELNDEIRSRKRQCDEIREAKDSIGSFDYSSDPVQTSKSPDARFTYAVEQLADLEAEVSVLLADRERQKQIIIEQINAMQDNRYKVLLRTRYVHCERFEACACELNYSLRQTLRLHRRALLAFAEQYRDVVIECHIDSMR